MGRPAPFIFEGLGPQQAVSRLQAAVLLDDSVRSSLAALGVGLETLEVEDEAILGVIHLIDQFVTAVNEDDLNRALDLKTELEERIAQLDSQDWSEALSRIVDGSSHAGTSQSPRASRRRPSQPLSVWMTIDGSQVFDQSAADPLWLAGPSQRRRGARGEVPPVRVIESELSVAELAGHAKYLREIGRNLEAAGLYRRIARRSLDADDFLQAAYFYSSEGVIRLELKDYAGAIASGLRVIHYGSKAVPRDTELLPKAGNFVDHATEQAIAGVRSKGNSKLANELIELYGDIIEVFQDADEKALEGNAHKILASLLFHLNHFDQAYSEAEAAANLFLEDNDFHSAGVTFYLMAQALEKIGGRRTLLLSTLSKAGHAFHRAGDIAQEARAYFEKARLLYLAKQYEDAAGLFARSARIYTQAKMEEEADEAFTKRLLALEKGGFKKKALHLWIERAQEAQRKRKWDRQAMAYFHIGRLWGKEGKSDSKIEFLTQAAELFLRADQPAEAATCYGLISLDQKGRDGLSAAEKSWQTGVGIIYEAEDQGGADVLYILLGNAFREFEEYEKAREMYEEALNGLAARGDSRLGETYEKLATVLVQLKLWNEADRVLRLASQFYSSTGDQKGVERVQQFKRESFPAN